MGIQEKLHEIKQQLYFNPIKIIVDLKKSRAKIKVYDKEKSI